MSRASLDKRFEARRGGNAASLAAFGAQANRSGLYRTVFEGDGPTVYTIGYERRDGEALIAGLIDAGVTTLLDVRERPMSRNPDFRRARLERLCNEAGVQYESWPELGSTDHQRESLKESGDFSVFRKRFRDLMVRSRWDVMERLADRVSQGTVAMICYEREHDECHRSILAELLHDDVDATIVAIA
ncbi:MAG: DUF488 family protein [Phycisphaerales bacterium JB054]